MRATPGAVAAALPANALGHPRAPMANEDSQGAEEGQGDQFHDGVSLRRTERAEKGSRKLLRIDESTARGWLCGPSQQFVPRGWPGVRIRREEKSLLDRNEGGIRHGSRPLVLARSARECVAVSW